LQGSIVCSTNQEPKEHEALTPSWMRKKDLVRKVLDMLDGELPQLGVSVKDNRNSLSRMFEKECTTTTSMHSKGKKVGFSNHDERKIESQIRKL